MRKGLYRVVLGGAMEDRPFWVAAMPDAALLVEDGYEYAPGLGWMN